MWELTKAVLLLVAGGSSLLLAASGAGFRADTSRSRASIFAGATLAAWLGLGVAAAGLFQPSWTAALAWLGCLLGVSGGVWLVMAARRLPAPGAAAPIPGSARRIALAVLALVVVDAATVLGLVRLSGLLRLAVVMVAFAVTVAIVAALHGRGWRRAELAPPHTA